MKPPLQRREDRPGIVERIGSAMSGERLAWGSGQHAIVVAMGLVSIKQPMADAVFGLKYGNDAKCYDDALVCVRKIARTMAMRDWPDASNAEMDAMAKLVLDYWLMDVCRACEGRGWEVAPGAPYLTDLRCGVCDPDRPGKRPYPWRGRALRMPVATAQQRKRARERMARQAEVEGRHMTLLCAVEEIERKVGDLVVRRLATRVRESGL